MPNELSYPEAVSTRCSLLFAVVAVGCSPPGSDGPSPAPGSTGGSSMDVPPTSSCPAESAIDDVGRPERRLTIQQTVGERTVELTKIENLTYGRHGGFALQADFIVPAALPSPAPGVLFFVHGGGWKDCENRRASVEPVALFWGAALEVGVVNIEYRLLGEGGEYPENIRDVRCAMRWARAQASSLGLDGSKMVLMGDSAGAHLVTLAALTLDREDLDDPSCGDLLPGVDGVVAFSGPYDLAQFSRAEAFPNATVTEDTGDSPRSLVTAYTGPCVDATVSGCVVGRGEPACVDASPAAHACGARSPFLLVHAPEGSDPLVPLTQAETLRNALLDAGSSVTLHVPELAALEALAESGVPCTPQLAHGYSPCLVFTTLEEVTSFIAPKLR